MKVIFLDIDGVMNSELFYQSRHRKRWLKPITYYWWIKAKIRYIFNGFKYPTISLVDYKTPVKHTQFAYKFRHLKAETDPIKWKWLVTLCEESECKICISSVWKRYFTLDEWDKVMILLGFKEDVLVGITGNRRSIRGLEIQEWLEQNFPIEKYAIIDDDNDMLPEQRENFFQSDGYCGLTTNLCYRIKNHFK